MRHYSKWAACSHDASRQGHMRTSQTLIVPSVWRCQLASVGIPIMKNKAVSRQFYRYNGSDYKYNDRPCIEIRSSYSTFMTSLFYFLNNIWSSIGWGNWYRVWGDGCDTTDIYASVLVTSGNLCCYSRDRKWDINFIQSCQYNINIQQEQSKTAIYDRGSYIKWCLVLINASKEKYVDGFSNRWSHGNTRCDGINLRQFIFIRTW